MDVANDGGFLQFMPHGKNHDSRLPCRPDNSETPSLMPPCDWMEAFFASCLKMQDDSII